MGMTNPWTDLAQTHGRKSVMSLAIDDATLDAETERQAAEIFPLIRGELRGDEEWALDYGCGYGRFTPYLADLIGGHGTLGYDPCADLLRLFDENGATYGFVTSPADVAFDYLRHRGPFDLIFTAMVLGDPNLDLEQTAVGLASILAPTGLLVVLDHMPEVEPSGRWWRFRPEREYASLFDRCGVKLRKIGMVRQLSEDVTILAGRKPCAVSPLS